MNNKVKYNPNIHHRRSIRLQGNDYSKSGFYYLTLICKDRIHRFGNVENAKMVYNDTGKIAHECWLEIPKHFPKVILHEFVIMPNHIHGIIELKNSVKVETENHQMPRNEFKRNEFQKMIPRSIGSIVKGYKIGVTKGFRKNHPQNADDEPVQFWQRDYYEHIIRNKLSYYNRSIYIKNNPAKWHKKYNN